jgi:hypothetical protein
MIKKPIIIVVALGLFSQSCGDGSENNNDDAHDNEYDSDYSNDGLDSVESSEDILEDQDEINPDVLDISPELPDEITLYCLKVASCIDGLYPSIGSCIFEIESNMAFHGVGLEEELKDCVINAGNDCHQVALCLYHDGIEPTPCNESTHESSCDGNIAINCIESVVTYWDCSNISFVPDIYEMTCIVEEPHSAECAGEFCDGFISRCNGVYIEYCNAGVFDGLSGQDCSFLEPSATCEENDEGISECVGSGPACVPDNTPRCEGDILIKCFNGKEAARDCSILGDNYTCRSSDIEAECRGIGDECLLVDDTYTDLCIGPILHYCYAGYISAVDCTSIGFSTCRSFEGVGIAVCE